MRDRTQQLEETYDDLGNSCSKVLILTVVFVCRLLLDAGTTKESPRENGRKVNICCTERPYHRLQTFLRQKKKLEAAFPGLDFAAGISKLGVVKTS